MKKKFLIIVLTLIFGCASQKNKESKKNYEITDSVTLKLNPTDSIKVNELRFKPNFSSDDLQKFMFNKYGKWNNLIATDRKENILVWENIKLFDDNGELFTVAVSGDDKKFELMKVNGKQKYGRIFYCSAIVFNSKDFDCLQPSSELKDNIAQYFINAVKSVDENNGTFKNEINTN